MRRARALAGGRRRPSHQANSDEQRAADRDPRGADRDRRDAVGPELLGGAGGGEAEGGEEDEEAAAWRPELFNNSSTTSSGVHAVAPPGHPGSASPLDRWSIDRTADASTPPASPARRRNVAELGLAITGCAEVERRARPPRASRPPSSMRDGSRDDEVATASPARGGCGRPRRLASRRARRTRGRGISAPSAVGRRGRSCRHRRAAPGPRRRPPGGRSRPSAARAGRAPRLPRAARADGHGIGRTIHEPADRAQPPRPGCERR